MTELNRSPQCVVADIDSSGVVKISLSNAILRSSLNLPDWAYIVILHDIRTCTAVPDRFQPVQLVERQHQLTIVRVSEADPTVGGKPVSSYYLTVLNFLDYATERIVTHYDDRIIGRV